jgi:hypothetical protein
MKEAIIDIIYELHDAALVGGRCWAQLGAVLGWGLGIR